MVNNETVKEYFKSVILKNPDYYTELITNQFLSLEEELYPYEKRWLLPEDDEIFGMIKIENYMYDKESLILKVYNDLKSFVFYDDNETETNDFHFNSENFDKAIGIMLKTNCKVLLEKSSKVKVEFIRRFKEAYEKRTPEEKLFLELEYPELLVDDDILEKESREHLIKEIKDYLDNYNLSEKVIKEIRDKILGS